MMTTFRGLEELLNILLQLSLVDIEYSAIHTVYTNHGSNLTSVEPLETDEKCDSRKLSQKCK